MERKFLKVVIIAMLLVCVCATIANALSFSVIMEPSKRVVPASTEFTVEIKVSNLDVGTNGINTLSGNLIYDTAVFETIGESSIEGRNGWSHSYNPENDGKITLTDATRLVLYNAGKIQLEEQYIHAGDINLNNNITITDVTRLILIRAEKITL